MEKTKAIIIDREWMEKFIPDLDGFLEKKFQEFKESMGDVNLAGLRCQELEADIHNMLFVPTFHHRPSSVSDALYLLASEVTQLEENVVIIDDITSILRPYMKEDIVRYAQEFLRNLQMFTAEELDLSGIAESLAGKDPLDTDSEFYFELQDRFGIDMTKKWMVYASYRLAVEMASYTQKFLGTLCSCGKEIEIRISIPKETSILLQSLEQFLIKSCAHGYPHVNPVLVMDTNTDHMMLDDLLENDILGNILDGVQIRYRDNVHIRGDEVKGIVPPTVEPGIEGFKQFFLDNLEELKEVQVLDVSNAIPAKDVDIPELGRQFRECFRDYHLDCKLVIDANVYFRVENNIFDDNLKDASEVNRAFDNVNIVVRGPEKPHAFLLLSIMSNGMRTITFQKVEE